jgi:Glycoside-hydrolase family GH114
MYPRAWAPLAALLLGLVAAPVACGDDDAGGAAGAGAAGEGVGGLAGGEGVGGAATSRPALTPGVTWQWQLSGLPLDTSVDAQVYDVDLFETTDAELAKLRADGRTVICYFSAGSFEAFRPDAGEFPDAVKGSPLDPPFADELWLDVRAPAVLQRVRARLDLAASRGCHGVEPDNVDGYANDNGFGLSEGDQLAFNRAVAAEAHARGLSVGLKNDLDQLADLVGDFDWALNEECFSFDECDLYADTFLAAGKAVLHAEYVEASQLGAVCAVTRPLGLSTLVKHIELDAWRLPCP